MTAGIIPGSVTYAIDKEGTVRLTFSSQTDIDRHVKYALRIVRSLAGQPAQDDLGTIYCC